ncbi:MAG: hypothetical protein IT379_01545, partial [Deltaproteobacteria bacterium]|nr:hypothetical protein [Deltaproteobacteria bacterium]
MPLGTALLRVLAATWILLAVSDVTASILVELTFDSSAVDSHSIEARLRTIWGTKLVVELLAVLVTLGAAVRGALAPPVAEADTRPKGRVAFAVASALLATYAIGRVVFVWVLVTRARDPLSWPVWLGLEAGVYVALVLVLVPVRPRAWMVAVPASALLVLVLVARAWPSVTLRWIVLGLSAVTDLTFAAACLTVRRDATEGVAATVIEGGAVAARALRQLASAMVLRWVLGGIGAAAVGWSVSRGVAAVPWLIAAVDCAIATWVIVALVGYRRLAEPSRTAGADLALFVTVIQLPAMIATAYVSAELADLVGRARGASSFWAMPSLRRIEELALALRALSIGSAVMGALGGIGLATSFARTAESLVAEEVAHASVLEDAKRLVGWVAGTSVSAAVLGAVVWLELGIPVMLLAGGALVLLLAALATAVQWVRVALALAHALEEPRRS